MSHFSLPPVQGAVYLSEFPTGSAILLKAMWQCVSPGTRASTISGQSGPQATNLLQTKPQQARFSGRSGMEVCGLRSRPLYLSGMRASWRPVERRPCPPVQSIPGSSVHVVQRKNAVCEVSQADSYVWVAGLLAQGSGP